MKQKVRVQENLGEVKKELEELGDYSPHTSCARLHLFGYTLSCEPCGQYYDLIDKRQNLEGQFEFLDNL